MYGSERQRWERIFDDDSMCRINDHLRGLPTSKRAARRREIFEAVLPGLTPGADITTLIERSGDAKARLDGLLRDQDQLVAAESG